MLQLVPRRYRDRPDDPIQNNRYGSPARVCAPVHLVVAGLKLRAARAREVLAEAVMNKIDWSGRRNGRLVAICSGRRRGGRLTVLCRCDCGNEHVVIVGAGNSSAQASLHLARYAREVSIVMRGERLKDNVSEYLVDRVTHTPNIEIVPKSLVVALHGDDMLRAVTLRNCETGEEQMIETSFLFLCLGGVPNTQWAKEVGIVRDEEGYLVTGPDLRKFDPMSESWKLNREPYYLETSMPGVFAAGDVRHGAIKRVVSAVGEGAMTIAFVHRYLASG